MLIFANFFRFLNFMYLILFSNIEQNKTKQEYPILTKLVIVTQNSINFKF